MVKVYSNDGYCFLADDDDDTIFLLYRKFFDIRFRLNLRRALLACTHTSKLAMKEDLLKPEVVSEDQRGRLELHQVV